MGWKCVVGLGNADSVQPRDSKTRLAKPIFYSFGDKGISSGGDMSFTTISLAIASIGGYLFIFIASRRWFPTASEGVVSDKTAPAPLIADEGDRYKSNLFLAAIAIGSILYFAFGREWHGDGVVSLVHARYLAEKDLNIVTIDSSPLSTVGLVLWYLFALPICIAFNLYYKNAVVLLLFVTGAIFSAQIIDIKFAGPLEENLMSRYHYTHCSSKDFTVGVGRGRRYYATYEPEGTRCASISPKP